MQHEIRRRNRDQHTRQPADDEGHHEADRPQHRRRKDDPAAIHGEQPVVDLDARRHRDDHRGDAEHRVDGRPGPHGEEMMQPHHEGNDADRHRGEHHRAVAEQRLAREGRNHFREHPERRQDEDINLRVAPHPDEVHEHHHVAAALVGEEVEAEVAVERQHRERRGENRKGGDDDQIGGERGPGENRHAHVGHAWSVDFQNGGDEIDPGHERSDAGNLDRP